MEPLEYSLVGAILLIAEFTYKSALTSFKLEDDLNQFIGISRTRINDTLSYVSTYVSPPIPLLDPINHYWTQMIDYYLIQSYYLGA